jgi:hypothetical protein
MTPQASPRKSEAQIANCTCLILAKETGLHTRVGGHRNCMLGLSSENTYTAHVASEPQVPFTKTMSDDGAQVNHEVADLGMPLTAA